MGNRFRKVMSFDRSTDRIPVIEWAPWWDETLDKWRQEGIDIPQDSEDLKVTLGLDRTQRCTFIGKGANYPERAFGEGSVSDNTSYDRIKHLLYPEKQVSGFMKTLESMAIHSQNQDTVSWFGFDGFFWFPRILFGIEQHLYAFYDEPDTMHRMNRDLIEYNKKIFKQAVSIVKPDFVTIAEDMSYKQGPMISKTLFDEFIKPYYLEFVPIIQHENIPVFVDSDGDVDLLTKWLLDCGVDGMMPIERRAGSDPVELRKKYPSLLMIGGFDKTVMQYGETEMRREFEHILPAIQSGGYIPSCDHQTPPDVSFENYKTFVRLLQEYCGSNPAS